MTLNHYHLIVAGWKLYS